MSSRASVLQRLDASGLRGWQRQAILLVVFVLLAAPLVGYRAVADQPLSVYDEWQYADRVHAVTQGNVLMRSGEDVSRWGEIARACRGVERIMPPSDCRPTRENLADPTPNYASPDPAPYFVATGLGAAVLTRTGLVDSHVTAGRLVGILWAGLSMWTLWLLARAFGASRPASAVVASTVLLVPAFLQQYIHITPHALDIPVGAFTALATLRFLRREWPVWVLPLAAVTIASVKGSNVVIAVAVGLALAAVVVWPGVDRGDRIRALVAGSVLSVSTLVTFAAVQLGIGALAVADHDPPGHYQVERLDWSLVAVDTLRFLTSWGEGPLAVPAAWLMLAMAGTAVAVWAGLVPDLPPYVRQLAPGYLLGAALGAVVLDVMVFVTTDQYFSVHLRYGLALFPLGLGFAALLLRTRTAIVVALVALVVYAALPALLGLDTVAI